MEKLVLKRVLSSLSNGDIISLNFVAEKTELSGDYKVLGTKKGRGKGGSILAELISTEQQKLTLSTKDSDSVVNIVVDGNLFGFESESEIPPVYEKNSSNSIMLKNLFKTFEKVSFSSPEYVNIVSEQVPELNGRHMIVGYQQLRGRSGQIVLTTSTGLEIWSYRHSGVIQSIETV